MGVSKGSYMDQLGFQKVYMRRGSVVTEYESMASHREYVYSSCAHLCGTPFSDVQEFLNSRQSTFNSLICSI